jgi:hypothetical protein
VFAYIDGSTGGMMLQLIMAGIVGGFVAIKLVAGNVVAGIVGRFRRPQEESETDLSAEASNREI